MRCRATGDARHRPCCVPRSLLVVVALLCGCRGANEPTFGEGVTTIPARASSADGDEAPSADPGAGVAERVEQGAWLGDPDAVALAQIGYAGAPAPLSEAAQRRHTVGDLALAEGQWERAATAFRGVLAESPESAQDFRGLALAHAGAGELDLAANALSEAIVREFPHAWHDYLQEPQLASLRSSGEHARLERLAARMRTLHAAARGQGEAATVTWAPGQGSRGAQAGVTIAGRFVPLAPRVWGTTVRDDASLLVDAYYDAGSDRVVNVNASARADAGELDTLNMHVHDAVSGRSLGQRTVDASGAAAFEVEAASLRYREVGSAWLDLRGRKATPQHEAGVGTVVVRASGIGLAARDATVHRIAWAL
jgi:hypothetical protein